MKLLDPLSQYIYILHVKYLARQVFYTLRASLDGPTEWVPDILEWNKNHNSDMVIEISDAALPQSFNPAWVVSMDACPQLSPWITVNGLCSSNPKKHNFLSNTKLQLSIIN